MFYFFLYIRLKKKERIIYNLAFVFIIKDIFLMLDLEKKKETIIYNLAFVYL